MARVGLLIPGIILIGILSFSIFEVKAQTAQLFRIISVCDPNKYPGAENWSSSQWLKYRDSAEVMRKQLDSRGVPLNAYPEHTIIYATMDKINAACDATSGDNRCSNQYKWCTDPLDVVTIMNQRSGSQYKSTVYKMEQLHSVIAPGPTSPVKLYAVNNAATQDCTSTYNYPQFGTQL